jgi:hypothetical protein
MVSTYNSFSGFCALLNVEEMSRSNKITRYFLSIASIFILGSYSIFMPIGLPKIQNSAFLKLFNKFEESGDYE